MHGGGPGTHRISRGCAAYNTGTAKSTTKVCSPKLRGADSATEARLLGRQANAPVRRYSGSLTEDLGSRQ